MAKPINVLDLRNDLLQVFQDVKDKKIGLKEAKQLTNTAGRILSSAKIELEYKNFTGQKDKIPFLETDK